MKKLLLAAAACLMMAGSSHATMTQTISLAGGGGLLGTTLLVNSAPITDNGVTFVAQFQVAGFDVAGGAAANLQQTAAGLGVAGNGSDGINTGDSLTITFAGLSSVSGGTVNFDGFSGYELSGIDVGGEVALLNGSLLTSNGPVSGFGPIPSFQLTGQDNFLNPAANSDFRALTFDGTFTATAAVPEPGSLAALAFMGVCVVTRRRRR